MENKAAIYQPKPNHTGKVIWPLLLEDIEARVAMGIAKHGGPLTTDNNRDALEDAYQEGIDRLKYMRQELEEKRTFFSLLGVRTYAEATTYVESLRAHNAALRKHIANYDGEL